MNTRSRKGITIVTLLFCVAGWESERAAPSKTENPAPVAAQSDTLDCLGDFCLGIRETRAIELFGEGVLDPPDQAFRHCYQSTTDHTFVTLGVDSEDSNRRVVDILVSSIPNCARSEELPLKNSIETCKGVRLGDSHSQLISHHGEATPRDKVGYPWQHATKGVEQYDYVCEQERYCATVTSVFVTKGRVIGIAVWYRDC